MATQGSDCFCLYWYCWQSSVSEELKNTTFLPIWARSSQSVLFRSAIFLALSKCTFLRGENLISVGGRLPNGGYDFAFIAHKLNENFHLMFKMIMGLNEKAFWNVNVARTMTPIADVVLYL